MLRLTLVFLVIALIAAFLGYGGTAGYAWEGGKVVFFVFLVLAGLSLVAGGVRRRVF